MTEHRFTIRQPIKPDLPSSEQSHKDRPAYGSVRVTPHHDPETRLMPDGRPYPNPSLMAKIVVWGGTGIMAAAATAGAVMLTRKVVDAVTGNDLPERPEPARRAAPVYHNQTARPARPQPAQPAPRAQMRFADAPTDAVSATPRRPAPRRRPKQSMVARIGDMTRTAGGVVSAITAATAAFRTVANQAPEVMDEFSRVARQARDMIDEFLPSSKPDQGDLNTKDNTDLKG